VAGYALMMALKARPNMDRTVTSTPATA
jgi:hypothetical protein